MAAPQIPLNQILPAIDLKDREFYNNLDDELKKKFSPFMLLKYAASVYGSPDLEDYYITSTNKHANKYMFDFADKRRPEHDHPQLQWLLLTTISPGVGKQDHRWIKMKPKPSSGSAPIRKILAEIHPCMKDDDLDVLSSMVTKKELNQYIKDRGEA